MRVHIEEVFQPLTVGVGRVTVDRRDLLRLLILYMTVGCSTKLYAELGTHAHEYVLLSEHIMHAQYLNFLRKVRSISSLSVMINSDRVH